MVDGDLDLRLHACFWFALATINIMVIGPFSYD